MLFLISLCHLRVVLFDMAKIFRIIRLHCSYNRGFRINYEYEIAYEYDLGIYSFLIHYSTC